MLCQFSAASGKKTLADYIKVAGVYPAGRLDFDSEGLLLLTDDGELQHRITDPKFGHPRTYWVQVEGIVHEAALELLATGVIIDGRKTLPCEAAAMAEPLLPKRSTPVRIRKSIPTSWLRLTLREGRNRQVRRMTAATGFPTLRLVRAAIGQLTLAGLPSGESRELTRAEVAALRGVNLRLNNRSYKSPAIAAARPNRD